MMWGTYRALSQSMVTGVTEGFSKVLEINGVGYRAAVEGSNLKLQLGSSHAVLFPLTSDVPIRNERPTAITVSSIDAQWQIGRGSSGGEVSAHDQNLVGAGSLK